MIHRPYLLLVGRGGTVLSVGLSKKRGEKRTCGLKATCRSTIRKRKEEGASRESSMTITKITKETERPLLLLQGKINVETGETQGAIPFFEEGEKEEK